MYATTPHPPGAYIRERTAGEDGENRAVPAFASFASKYTEALGIYICYICSTEQALHPDRETMESTMCRKITTRKGAAWVGLRSSLGSRHSGMVRKASSALSVERSLASTAPKRAGSIPPASPTKLGEI